ncbi:MAG: DUF3987 domain-containing protein [Betaproteobacteria bacterium]|nr:DUF3987 domain-containing protein [Betaproteobacteria bacterium]
MIGWRCLTCGRRHRPAVEEENPALSEVLKARHRLEKSITTTPSTPKPAADPETKIKRKLPTQELTTALQGRARGRGSGCGCRRLRRRQGQRRAQQLAKTEPRAAAVIIWKWLRSDAPPSGNLQSRFPHQRRHHWKPCTTYFLKTSAACWSFAMNSSACSRAGRKQGHEQDRAFYLEAWNGHGSFPLDRIGRGHVVCDNMCVSILGGT